MSTKRSKDNNNQIFILGIYLSYLKWHYSPHNSMSKVKDKVSVYFVKSVFGFIINIFFKNDYSIKKKIDALILTHVN